MPLPVGPGRHGGAQEVQAGEGGGGKVDTEQEEGPEQEEEKHTCSVRL